MDLPVVDLVSSGPPCQPFSKGGLGRGQHDHRNLFSEVLRMIRLTRPPAFLIENVRGLLFERNRPYFDYLVAQLRNPSCTARGRDTAAHLATLQSIPESGAEYWVDWRLVNSADYGLAQNRVRLVIIGLDPSIAPFFTWPKATHSKDALLQALKDDEYWEKHEVPKRVRHSVQITIPEREFNAVGRRWLTVRDLLRRLGPPSNNGQSIDSAHTLVSGARLYSKHTGSALDWPAKTVKAGVHGCPGGEHIVLMDDGSHRYFTVRECAALQGFPDDYALPAKRGHAMRQLGNAVPVVLAEVVGRKLAEALESGG